MCSDTFAQHRGSLESCKLYKIDTEISISPVFEPISRLSRQSKKQSKTTSGRLGVQNEANSQRNLPATLTRGIVVEPPFCM